MGSRFPCNQIQKLPVNLIPGDPPGPERGQRSGGFDSFKQADSWGLAIR